MTTTSGEPRVTLRRPTAADEAAFVAAMRVSASHHHPWLYPPTTPAAYAAYLQRVAGERYDGFLARRVADDEIVGWLNISEIVRGALQSAFIGYGGVAAHAGRGYMTEALTQLVDHAFGELGLHRLEANIQPDNASSIALVRRLGFAHEGFSPRYLKIGGVWRDHDRYALRAEDWRGRRSP
ncbi:MAG TPA: GNAT family protein [Solirubrobacteraceae bacterium]